MAFRGSKLLERLIAFRKEKPEKRHVTKKELQIRYARATDTSIREAGKNEEFQEIHKLWKSPRRTYTETDVSGLIENKAGDRQRRQVQFQVAIKLGYFEKINDKWVYVG